MYPSSASATIGIVQKCVRFLACVLMFLLLLQRRNRYERVCRSSEVMVLAQRVANKEELKLSQDELRQVAESAGGDLRQLLNQLQLIQLQRGIDSSSLTPSNSSTDTSNNQSVFIPHYPNTKEDLSFPRGKRRPSRSLSFLRDANAPHRRYSAVFSDYELVPLLLQQNYLEPLKGEGAMEAAARAADAIADMELAHAAMVARNVGEDGELQSGLVASADCRLAGGAGGKPSAGKLHVPAVPGVGEGGECEVGCWGRVRRCGRMGG